MVLFNIYVADLPSLAREHGAKMPSFADDMTLHCSHTVSCSCLQYSFRSTERYFSCPRAPRSLDQCFPKRLPWSLPHTPEHAKVSQRACGFCCRMRKLNSFRKLVFWELSIIDDSLSWSPHVDSICKKVGRKIGALRHTYRQLTLMARRQFFVSVI